MKRAVLLFSMGGPDGPKDVQPFLFRLFNDPAILRVPSVPRFLLSFFISLVRAPIARKVYRKLGGGSPLLKNTRAQAQALEKELGKDHRCFVGMSYSRPFIAQAMNAACAQDPDEIVLLPLYPQYSTTTTASVLRDALREIEKRKPRAVVRIVRSFPEEEGFIAAMAESIRLLYEKANLFGAPLLLLSAHGLPEKIVLAGDPYPEECLKTAQAIIDKIGYKNLDWRLCYQSRIGPMKWIGPETRAEIIDAARKQRPIIVAPIAFVSEHAETLIELKEEYREIAQEEGCPLFLVAETVSTTPLFIKGLARLVTNF